MTARTWTPEELLNHQALWTAFLQRLSHHDPEYDLEVIRSFLPSALASHRKRYGSNLSRRVRSY